MLIPTCSIHIRLTNGASGTLHAPRYVADILRVHLAAKLDRDSPGQGLEVVPAADHTPVYRETLDVAAEERFWKAVYPGSFDKAHPEGLTSAIRALVVEDAERQRRLARKGAVIANAHESFTKASIPSNVAIACQEAGYPTLKSLPADIVVLAAIPGVDNAMAARLAELVEPKG